MNSFEDLYWDIESMYIDGVGAKRIAQILECDLSTVYAVLEDMGVASKPLPEDQLIG
jgi:hypothetical protein